MKKYIVSLLIREKARLDKVTEEQKKVEDQLENLRKVNQALFMEVSARTDRIHLLNELLNEEEIEMLNGEEE